ncbi:hypothetical protein SUGI_0511240 [Cryptomeria japonica]|nr:hypothetical protein SUGI_0511240 [Cryptomeria japonica]
MQMLTEQLIWMCTTNHETQMLTTDHVMGYLSHHTQHRDLLPQYLVATPRSPTAHHSTTNHRKGYPDPTIIPAGSTPILPNTLFPDPIIPGTNPILFGAMPDMRS